jgi:hypothetical protein
MITKEIKELKLKIKNIKEELTHDMENYRKKEQKHKTHWKKTTED